MGAGTFGLFVSFVVLIENPFFATLHFWLVVDTYEKHQEVGAQLAAQPMQTQIKLVLFVKF